MESGRKYEKLFKTDIFAFLLNVLGSENVYRYDIGYSCYNTSSVGVLIMKVFHCNVDGIFEKLIAAKSKKEAADKMNVSYKHFLKYGNETGVKKDMELALNNYGKVFKKEIVGINEWV